MGFFDSMKEGSDRRQLGLLVLLAVAILVPAGLLVRRSLEGRLPGGPGPELTVTAFAEASGGARRKLGPGDALASNERVRFQVQVSQKASIAIAAQAGLHAPKVLWSTRELAPGAPALVPPEGLDLRPLGDEVELAIVADRPGQSPEWLESAPSLEDAQLGNACPKCARVRLPLRPQP